jgi:Tol biopolymer transport system component/DNA-binding SARP family transcriptional activator
MFRLRVLGGFVLEGPSGTGGQALPRRRAEAALAVLAVCGDLGCARERLMGLLWPESDEAHSRHGLRDALAAIRQVLGPDAVVAGGDRLRLNSAVVDSDVIAFTTAFAAGRLADAADAYSGPLLTGFHVDDAPDFERWLDGERTRLEREHGEVLERLATAAERGGAWGEAAGWWARAEEHDPLNSHLALRHAEALVAVGDRANAIKVADAHLRRLKRDLELEPDREVLSRVERLRRGDVPGRGPGARAPVHGPGASSAREVEGAAGRPEALGTEGAPAPPVTAAAAPRRSHRSLQVFGAVVGVVILAVLARRFLERGPLRLSVTTLTQLTSGPGVDFQPSLSPDGQEVAYAAGTILSPRVFVRSTANTPGAAAVRLTDTTGNSQWVPVWSPDGKVVRFNECPRTWIYGSLQAESVCVWKEAGPLGGAAHTMALPAGAVRPAWSQDGASVAFLRHDSIFTMAISTGRLQPIMVPAYGDRGEPHSMAWSPDGRLIAFVSGAGDWRMGSNRLINTTSRIWVVDANGGEPRSVTTGEHLNVSPVWLDAGHLLFVSDREGLRALYVVAVGPHGAKGEPVAVPGVSDPHAISFSRQAGVLAFAKLAVRQNILAFPLSRPGPVSIRAGRPVTAGDHVVVGHDVSPDGQWIVFDGTYAGAAGLFRKPIRGGEAVPLNTLSPAMSPRWSPDGREIVFSTFADSGQVEMMVMAADGGAPQVLTSGGWSGWPTWSPDGLHIAYWYFGAPRSEMRMISRDSVKGPWHRPVRFSGPCSMQDWAPDGRAIVSSWLCDEGRMLGFRAPDGHTLTGPNVPLPDGLTHLEDCIRYSRDGKTLYVVGLHKDGRRGVWAIPVRRGGVPRLVVAFDDPTLSVPFPEGNLSVGPRELYLTVAEHQSDIWVARLKW